MLCWYLTSVKEVISVLSCASVCVLTIVGIVACKYQSLLYVGDFARVVIC